MPVLITHPAEARGDGRLRGVQKVRPKPASLQGAVLVLRRCHDAVLLRGNALVFLVYDAGRT